MTTYEEIVDAIVERLRKADVVPPSAGPIPWNAFVRLSDLIHATYEVPGTTFTPMMRRLLFGLGHAAQSSTIVGVGTHVGYTFSWLLRNRVDEESLAVGRWRSAVGIDMNAGANTLARRNCSVLGHGDRLTFLDADGVDGVSRSDGIIDLLYLDLDDPARRKAAYRDVLEAAIPRLRQGALILAHDPCVPVFQQNFADYDRFVTGSGVFRGPWVLRVDSCGLSVAVVR
jgi:predicted O-methyltransferase YrrM